MTRPHLALFVVILTLLPARAGAEAGFGPAMEGSALAANVAFAPGQTVPGSATGSTGATTGAATGVTGASASPSPSGANSPLSGAGFIVLGLLLGAFLLLRTRLLRRRP